MEMENDNELSYKEKLDEVLTEKCHLLQRYF
jgi:hypothetical protein